MGVIAELENLGDAHGCRRTLRPASNMQLSDKRGHWRVAIAGSRASENREMRIEGPDGFERTYTLAGAAGEHEPEAIRRLIIQLVSRSSSLALHPLFIGASESQELDQV